MSVSDIYVLHVDTRNDKCLIDNLVVTVLNWSCLSSKLTRNLGKIAQFYWVIVEYRLYMYVATTLPCLLPFSQTILIVCQFS